jgi:VIT family
MHDETHLIGRIGWLRAAVLGANDGIISTASLILGVASAAVSQSEVLLAGVAGLVAGAMSLAAGEYLSVSSQSDTEGADLAREKRGGPRCQAENRTRTRLSPCHFERQRLFPKQVRRAGGEASDDG